jgi:hypothetical protein
VPADAHEARAVAGGSPLQHLLVAVGGMPWTFSVNTRQFRHFAFSTSASVHFLSKSALVGA